MDFKNNDEYLQEYEKGLETSKKLLTDYKDFNRVIVPIVQQYSKINTNEDFKFTAQWVLRLCDMAVKQLEPVCNGVEKVTYKELNAMNSNLEWLMSLIQKTYKNIATIELPQFNDEEFNV